MPFAHSSVCESGVSFLAGIARKIAHGPLVSYRYMRGSTAITTNKSVKDWPAVFAGDEALTSAILDRLLHKSVVLNIRGRSYRLQDLEKMLK